MPSLLQHLILAVQFLTRLPTPQIQHFQPQMLASSAVWFPLIGLLIGGLLCLVIWPAALLDAWLAAWLGMCFWVLVTGGLHLDGLADLSDALGASHRDPERLLAVMRDPHLGSFGVLSLGVLLSGKLVLMMLTIQAEQWMALLLIPAWARFSIFYWQTLPPLQAGGMAEQFSWSVSGTTRWLWLLVLLAASLALCPVLLAAPVMIVLYRYWLQRTLGGVSGDCLGAGVEISELCLLLLVVCAHLINASSLVTQPF
ncbi:MAG: adenosylcobinamide-GDP ribazoletransferase [Pseudomonadota bacterium]|nr:adenosylcobinamide-GDP ribazoletransferase [Pseudomonadota bacterium]